MNSLKPYDLSRYEAYSDEWIKYYCLNRVFLLNVLGKACKNLLLEGGVGGDVEWGIHRWDKFSYEDYGLDKFSGFRYYLGEDEHGKSELGDLDAFFSEDDLKVELAIMIRFQLDITPELDNELMKVCDELSIAI